MNYNYIIVNYNILIIFIVYYLFRHFIFVFLIAQNLNSVNILTDRSWQVVIKGMESSKLGVTSESFKGQFLGQYFS